MSRGSKLLVVLLIAAWLSGFATGIVVTVNDRHAMLAELKEIRRACGIEVTP